MSRSTQTRSKLTKAAVTMKLIETIHSKVDGQVYQLIHMEADDKFWPEYVFANYILHTNAPSVAVYAYNMGMSLQTMLDPANRSKGRESNKTAFTPYNSNEGVCLVRGELLSTLPPFNEWGEVSP